ncbi:MAG: hypothetical protein JWM88_432 [Verrucomicrobia bacterium]|nr:hypothetical protein [Verrucomicrobiota bacterium]
MIRGEIQENKPFRNGCSVVGSASCRTLRPARSSALILPGVLLGLIPIVGFGASDTEPPSVPNGLSATRVAPTGFALAWNPSTDNVRVTAYEVSLDGRPAAPTPELFKEFTSLAPESSHVVSVRARDAKGNWSASSRELRVSTAADVSAPTIPGEIRAENIKLKSFTLTWAASADDVKTTGYEVWIDGVSLGVVAGRSKTVSSLAPGTSYSATVRARDAAGNWSAASEVLRVRTLADTTPPSTPEDLRAPAVSTTRFLLKWNAANDDMKVAGYEIFKDGVSLGCVTGTSRRILQLDPATSYTMTVKAFDAAGNHSPACAPLVVKTASDTHKPSAPRGLAAGVVTAAGFGVSWSPSKDDVGVTAYEIFRGGVSIGSTIGLSFWVGGLSPGTSYSVAVKARDAAGNWSGLSAALKITTPVGEPPAPSVPGGLVGSDVTSSGFVLAWMPSAGKGAISYEVFRDAVSMGMTAATSMAIAGLAPGSTQLMRVRAKDDTGRWSDFSAGLPVVLPEKSSMDGFEAIDGYQLGPLDGQNNWSVTGRADVVATPVYAGTQAISVQAGSPASFALRGIETITAGVTFVDFYALPAAADAPDAGVFFETAGARISLAKSGDHGRFHVFDGDGNGGGAWRSIGEPVALTNSGSAADWTRVTVRLDRPAGCWDLCVNGKVVAAEMGFVHSSPAAPEILTLGGHATQATGFDGLLISGENPVAPDADHDGMDDSWEVERGLNSTMDDRRGDADHDGILNIDELVLGTEPNNPDSDHDGMPDGWELTHGLNPMSGDDALRDDDGDGASNRQEFLAGTNPEDFYNGRALVVVASSSSPSEITYSYDASGRLTRADYPSGASVQFFHDAASNVTRVATTGRSPIVDWRIAHGLPSDGSGPGADMADPAGDGLPNLAKYGLGMDPSIKVSADCPVISRILEGGLAYRALTYFRPDPARTDVVLSVEVSTDGATWVSGSGTTVAVGTTVNQAIAAVTVRDATPLSESGAARRMRLKIQKK